MRRARALRRALFESILLLHLMVCTSQRRESLFPPAAFGEIRVFPMRRAGSKRFGVCVMSSCRGKERRGRGKEMKEEGKEGNKQASFIVQPTTRSMLGVYNSCLSPAC